MPVILEIDAKSDLLAHLVYTQIVSAEALLKSGMSQQDMGYVIEGLVDLARQPVELVHAFFVAGLRGSSKVRFEWGKEAGSREQGAGSGAAAKPPPAAVTAAAPVLPGGYKAALPEGVKALNWMEKEFLEKFDALPAEMRLVHWDRLTDEVQRMLTAARKILGEKTGSLKAESLPSQEPPKGGTPNTEARSSSPAPAADPAAEARAYIEGFGESKLQLLWVMRAQAGLDGRTAADLKQKAGISNGSLINENTVGAIERYAVMVAEELLMKGLPLPKAMPPTPKRPAAKKQEAGT